MRCWSRASAARATPWGIFRVFASRRALDYFPRGHAACFTRRGLLDSFPRSALIHGLRCPRPDRQGCGSGAHRAVPREEGEAALIDRRSPPLRSRSKGPKLCIDRKDRLLRLHPLFPAPRAAVLPSGAAEAKRSSWLSSPAPLLLAHATSSPDAAPPAAAAHAAAAASPPTPAPPNSSAAAPPPPPPTTSGRCGRGAAPAGARETPPQSARHPLRGGAGGAGQGAPFGFPRM